MDAHVVPGQAVLTEPGAPAGYSLQDAVKKVADMSPPAVPQYVKMDKDGIIDLGSLGLADSGEGQSNEIIVEIYDDCSGQPGEGEECRDEVGIHVGDYDIVETETNATCVEISVHDRKSGSKKTTLVNSRRKTTVDVKEVKSKGSKTPIKPKKFWSLDTNKNKRSRVEAEVVVEDKVDGNESELTEVVEELPVVKKFWALSGKKNNIKGTISNVVIVEDIEEMEEGEIKAPPNAKKFWSLANAKKKCNVLSADVVVIDNDVKKDEKRGVVKENLVKPGTAGAGGAKTNKRAPVAKKFWSLDKSKKLTLKDVTPEVVAEVEKMSAEEGGSSADEKEEGGKHNRGEAGVSPIVSMPIQVFSSQARQPINILPLHSELTPHVHPRVNTDYTYIPARQMPKPKKVSFIKFSLDT